MNTLTSLKNLATFRGRSSDEILANRKNLDRYLLRYLRTCAVCKSMLPPIDFLCPSCWRALGNFMNRGEHLKQPDYVIPTYSLLTWTPQSASFVKPLIYGYKGGRAALASEKLATLFLNERGPVEKSVLVSAPAKSFDHSVLWTKELARQTQWPAIEVLDDKSSRSERQKELQAGERGLRRFALKEHFAYPYDLNSAVKRIVFADDVVTSGSTAMAAYMALGDPEQFEVWSLVARPRLATKQGAC